MTFEQQRTIDVAVYDAIEALPEALPNGNERQLTEWTMEHRFPSFSRDVKDALLKEGLKDLIRKEARNLSVALQE